MSSFFETRNPGRSGVTMNAEMPLLPLRASGVSVRAIARMTPACEPLVTHAFVPSRIQSLPSRRAWQRSDAASEPARSGSRSILVPLDGTAEAEAVLPEVDSIARKEGARLRLVHVAELPDTLRVGDHVVSYADQETERIELEMLVYLRGVGARLRGLPVERVVRFGEPTREILAEAEACFLEKAYRHFLPAGKVPVLLRPAEDLATEQISPEEYFLLSRIDGTWDVKSIIQVTPMREVDVVRTLKRMREKGFIELRDPEAGAS